MNVRKHNQTLVKAASMANGVNARLRNGLRASRACGIVAVAALALGGVADRAAAGLGLSIQGVDREVAAYGTSFCPGCGENGEDETFSNGDSIPSSLLGVFDESVFSVGSEAGQLSLVNADEISGEGSIGLGSTGDNNALSSLLVDFMVFETGMYQLSGDVMISPQEFETESRVVLSAGPTELYSAVQSFGGSLLFDESIALQTGVLYTLEAAVSGSDFEGIGSSGSWHVSLIPEPASLVLLGGLLVGVTARRRAVRA
ncbi:MAG: PEP-CTERM sorting domain-containing protein [Phycisphaerales bacterium]|nr:PEP-CTERM sorting domain-containing protein [Phycisphaerales bacterium]